jgi:hypothetical protein
MNLLLACGLLLATLAAAALEAQKTWVDVKGDPLPKGMIRIDGAKTPELIPQWLLWREAFLTLALTKPPPSGFWEPLEALTPEESDLLYRECLAQRERNAQLEKIILPEQKRLEAAGEDWPVVMQKLQALEEQWRWTILEARDRVLNGLSPESREVLLNEIDSYRRDIASVMPEADLEHFKRPQ